MYNYPMNKTITAPQYLLLYITEPLEEIGKKTWYHHGTFDSEEQAIAALLSMPESSYQHARMVKVNLPVLTLPDDFETITGELTHA